LVGSLHSSFRAKRKGHYSNPGFKENQTFSVCLPSEDMVEVTDYCGIVSGKKNDKAENRPNDQRLSFNHGM